MSTSFPSAVWAGQSATRNSSTVRRPDAADYQRLVDEIAALETFIRTNFQTAQNAAATVQTDSTTQGWLPPRMTTTQMNAITSPPEGLVIYNTTAHTLYVYNGTAWKAVTVS